MLAQKTRIRQKQEYWNGSLYFGLKNKIDKFKEYKTKLASIFRKIRSLPKRMASL